MFVCVRNIPNCLCSEDYCDLPFLLVAEENICFYYSFLGLHSFKTATCILIRFFFWLKFALLGRKQLFCKNQWLHIVHYICVPFLLNYYCFNSFRSHHPAFL